MKKLLIFVIPALSLPLAAQGTRRAVIPSTESLTRDTTPNSDQAPDVYVLTST